jgi:hypothetical protein
MRQDNATRSVKQFEIHAEAIRVSSSDLTRSFLHVAQRKLISSPYTVISVQTTEQAALNPVVLFTYTFILSFIHTVIPISFAPFSLFLLSFTFSSVSLFTSYRNSFHVPLLFLIYVVLHTLPVLIVSFSYYLPRHYIILLTQPP